MSGTTYGVGGYDPAKPFDNALTMWDDAARTYHDYRTGQDVTRLYTAAENTAADRQAADAARRAEAEADRAAIVDQALVWLAADSAQAATRAGQITQAIADIDAQITSVTGYTFAGSNVAGINASLNNALKPQIVAMLRKLRGAAVMLDELNTMRDRHNDALAWIGRTIT